MPDGLYERDILVWSEHQADLIRRLGRGERVNDVDWDNVAEEIESVGRSELSSVKSYLRLIVVHILKIYLAPDAVAVNHWRQEIRLFQASANDSFSPSMRQRLEVEKTYRDVVRGLMADDKTLALPDVSPFALDQLLNEDVDELLGRLPPRY